MIKPFYHWIPLSLLINQHFYISISSFHRFPIQPKFFNFNWNDRSFRQSLEIQNHIEECILLQKLPKTKLSVRKGASIGLGRDIFKGSRGRSICFGLMTLISEIGWIPLTQTVVSPTLPTIVTPPLPPFGERAFPQSRAPLYHGSILPFSFFFFPHFTLAPFSPKVQANPREACVQSREEWAFQVSCFQLGF